MARKQMTFVNNPPIETHVDNTQGSTGVVRNANVFIFIPDKPEPSYSRLVNIIE
jgi:hypothetical protein